MKIAVIGWGSLLWSPRQLRVIEGPWNKDGPILPIEFARISHDGRLTLVIYPGAPGCRTYWKLSTGASLEDARENLRDREATPHLQDIGVYHHHKDIFDSRWPEIRDTMVSWCQQKNIDAAIWTDLAPRFTEIAQEPFSEISACEYLSNLTGPKLEIAREYIIKAPEQTKTGMRKALIKRLEELKPK